MSGSAIVTNQGLLKIASASPEDQLTVTQIAVGDGVNQLDPNATGLVNEVYRAASSDPIRSGEYLDTLIFELNIPPTVGGFTVREIGAFDSNGDMIAVGTLDEVVKPMDGLNYTPRIYIKLQNAAQVDVFYDNQGAIDHGGLRNRNAVGAHDDIYTRKVNSIHQLLTSTTEKIDGITLRVHSYHGGVSGTGGGFFVWDSAISKSEHDGGTVIDPGKTFPSDWGDQTQFDNWFTGDGVGVGAYVRLPQQKLTDYDFGASLNSSSINHDNQMASMRRASSNLNVTVSLMSEEYNLSDTQIVAEDNVSIVGKVCSNGKYTKINRRGTVDIWRSCFHVVSSGTFFDKLYLYADDGFSERGGITYGGGAGRGNKIGHVQGAYWRLGVVYPKDTNDKFELSIDKLTAYYSGRVYASSTENTPYGAIEIGSTEGVYTGFIDVSGGSLILGSHSIRNTRSQALKKGNEGVGGRINVESIHACNGLADCRLNTASAEITIESEMEGALFTGQTSGATGQFLGGSREHVLLENCTGTFIVGETVTSAQSSFVVDTLEQYDEFSGLDDGVVGNAGNDFDSITIGTLVIDDYPGDILWILNNGIVNIGSIVAKGLTGCRHILRYSPDTNGVNPDYKSSLTIDSITVDGATMQNVSSYLPLRFDGFSANVTIGSMNMLNVNTPVMNNFMSTSLDIQVNSMRIETTGGTFSRFLNFSGSGLSSISNCFLTFDGANRIGTVSNGTVLFNGGRYPAGTSSFDGAGTKILNEFSSL